MAKSEKCPRCGSYFQHSYGSPCAVPMTPADPWHRQIEHDEVQEGKDTTREEFEEWAKYEGYLVDRHQSRPDEYEVTATQDVWTAWKGSRVVRQPNDPPLPRVIRTAVELLCDTLARVPWLEAPLKRREINRLRDHVRALLTAESNVSVHKKEAGRNVIAEAIRLARDCQSMETADPTWTFTEQQILAMALGRPSWIRLNGDIFADPLIRRVKEWQGDVPVVSGLNPRGKLSYLHRIKLGPSDWEPCEIPEAYRP